MKNLTVGTEIEYVNGSPNIQRGVIRQIYGSYYIVIDKDNESGNILFNSGYAVGDNIMPDQVKRIIETV